MAACAGVIVLVLLLLHTPPARRVVLDQVVEILADGGIVLRADTLSYNLLAPRASLTNVAVAAETSPDAPFLTADRIDIELPRGIFLGRVAIDRLRLENPRVEVIARADGTTNLPVGADDGTEAGEPAALPIGRLDVSGLALRYVDEGSDLEVELPQITLAVSPADGTLRLVEPGRVAFGEQTTTIDALGGGVAFDGRTLALTGFTASTPEGSLTLSGTVALLVEQPSLDLRVDGGADLAALGRWADEDPMAAGTVALEGSVAGPFDAPNATLRLRSDQVTWQSLVIANLDVQAAGNAERVTLSDARARLAGGTLQASGGYEVPAETATLRANWSDLDLGTLARAAAPGADVRPAGRSGGSLTFSGRPAAADSWAIDASLRVAGAGGGPGRVTLPGESSVRVANGEWRLDATHQVQGAPVRANLSGRLDAGELTASTVAGRVSVAETGIVPLVDGLRAAGLADVPPDTVTAGTIAVDAQVGGTFASPRLDATAALNGLSAAGVPDVAATVRADGTLQRMAVDAQVRQGTANEVAVSGTVFPEAARLDARLTGRLNDPDALAPGVPLDGAIDVDLQASGAFAAPTANGTLTWDNARYDRYDLGRLSATLDADPAMARVDLAAPELALDARAEVTLTGERTALVDLRIADADLARLTRDLEVPAPVRGVLGLAARVEAPLDEWRRGTASIDLSTLDLRFGDLPVRLASPGRVTFDDRTLDVERLDAEVGAAQLSLGGRLPIDDLAPAPAAADALRASLTGDVIDLVEAVRATGLTEVPAITGAGDLAFVARVSGTAERPVVAADLELAGGELAVDDLPAVRGLTVRAQMADGWIQPVMLAGEWQGSAITASGRVPLRLFAEYLPPAVLEGLPPTEGPATLEAQARSITPEVLTPFLDPEALQQIGGRVDATVQLRASSLAPEDITGEARLDQLDLVVAGLPIAQRQPTRIVLENGVARVANWDWTGQGASLGVQGEVNLMTRQVAILSAGRLDLRLATPFVREAGVTVAGAILPRVSVFGSLDDPTIDGELTLQGGEVRLQEPRIIATGVNGFAVLTPQQLRLTSLSGVVNGGDLSGSGEVAYGAEPVTVNLSALIEGMGIELPDGLRSELDIDLDLALVNDPAGARGSVTGLVTVLRSAYREPIAVVTQLLSGLREERLAAAAAPAALEETLADRLTLDVRVVTEEDVVVDNNLAQLQLGGDLRVIGTAAAPSLSGRVALREGGQLFLGRNVYAIAENSTIDFADPFTIQPDLNVQATTRAGGEDIELTLRGTPDTLEPELFSPTRPELGQADLASLLITGRTLDEVSGAEGQIVGEQVLSYLSGDVLGAAGRVVGLDTVRLGGVDNELRRDPAAVAARTDPTSRLTFGKSIGRDIEITYSQSLRDGDAQTWIVDYTPLPQVDLRLVSDDETLRSYEFRHDVAIGRAPVVRGGQGVARREEPDVAAVTLTGVEGALETSLRQALRLEPGDRFDFSEWQRDRDRLEERLFDAGRYEARVAATRDEGTGGVALAYAIEPGPQTTIAVTGYEPSSATRARLVEAWTQSVFDDFLREEVADVVRDALFEQGYLEPAIDVALTGDAAARTLAIAVAPGERITSRRIDVQAGDETLAAALEAWAEASGIDAFRQPSALEAALVAELRARGYLAPTVEVQGVRIDGRAAVLPVAIAAGPVFAIAGVEFPGAERITTERLREAAALAPGARFDPLALDEARDRVEGMYRLDGFNRARVVARVGEADGTAVPVSLIVEEGPRDILREVAIAGSQSIDEDVIRRELELAVGDPLGADAWLAARARLSDSGLFRRVDVTTEAIGEPVDGEQPTRVRVTVEEWPALRVRYGFQLSEVRPEAELEGRDLSPGISADATRRILFGRAITVGAATELRRRERVGRVFMTTPRLFGLGITSLLTAERSRLTFADAQFITDRSGVSWEQRTRQWPNLQLSYSYRFDRQHTYDTEPPSGPFDIPVDTLVNIARLSGSAVFDTRDDPTDTRVGLLLSSNLEVAALSLGSDIRFTKHLGQAYYFLPWRGVVFASAARIGLAAPRGGQVLPLSELFLAGGARTIRGVVEEGLGPQFFGEPDGGRALVLFNHEARFPVYRWLRGVGFLDTGNLFATPADIEFGAFVTGIGAGIRVNTPFALLRVDYARLITNAGDLRQARWTFGIGHTF